MEKKDIIDKVKTIEAKQKGIEESKEYEQRCVKSKVCPKCGNTLKEKTVDGTNGVLGSWKYYICECKYEIEVNNHRDKNIIWRKDSQNIVL